MPAKMSLFRNQKDHKHYHMFSEEESKIEVFPPDELIG